MKLINTASIKKEKKTTKEQIITPVIDSNGKTAQDRMKEMIPEEYNKWNAIHGVPTHKFGKVTSAWAGLQWADCSDYLHIRCGCGSTFIQHKHKGPCQVIKT